MKQDPATTAAYTGGAIQCRVYDYQSERQCDAHVDTFTECIHAVKDVTPEGFAAIKVGHSVPPDHTTHKTCLL